MPSSPIHRIRALYNADNSSHSQVLIGIGAHRSQTNPFTIIKRTSSTTSEVKLKIPWDKILLDLNRLPCDGECPSNGCKLDVYLTVRHRPGCSHDKRSEYKIGSRIFDFIGKGTYIYKQGDDIDSVESPKAMDVLDYCKKCDEFAARCDKLLSDMSHSFKPYCERKKSPQRFSRPLKEVAVIKTVVNVNEKRVNELLQRKKLRKSEETNDYENFC